MAEKEFKRKPNRKGLDRTAAVAFSSLYRAGNDKQIGNATECYMALHPKASRKTASSMGSRWLNDPLVQELLEEHNQRVLMRADITQERIMNELACLGFYNPQDFFNADGSPKSITELDERAARAITGLDTVNIGNGEEGIGQVLKLKLADKRPALVDMGKHIGMFKERIEHTGKDGGPIETKELSDNEVARRMAFLLTKAAKGK